MKKALYILCSIVFPSLIYGQYGNEWIDYSQTYYKFPISETGVYRITYSDLDNAGFPVASVDPRNLQIFGHEKEVTLYVEGESDGTFDVTDYIEFYAEKPDGRLDSLIFRNTNNHVNKFYNYFSDTINYFITWNSSISNKRYAMSNSSDYASYTAKPYVFHKKHYSPATNYRHGVWQVGSGGNNISDPRYLAGEGYFSGWITRGGTITANIDVSNPYLSPTGPNARVYSASSTQGQYLIDVGKENRSNHVVISHSTFSGTDKTIFDNTYIGVKVDKFSYSILNSDLYDGNMSFKYSLVDDTGLEQDYYAFAELEINYPHTTDFEGLNYFEFNFTSDETDAIIRSDVTNVSGTQIRSIDVSGGTSMVFPNLVSGTNHFVFPNIPGQETKYVQYSNEALKSVSTIQIATSTGQFENYLDNVLDNNVILITHKDFWSEVSDYKSYRESLAGGQYNVTVVDIEELYDQFGEGIWYSALSVRRFLKGTLDLWTEAPKGVFVIGKGVNLGTHIKNNKWGIRREQSARDRCFIPVLGEPATENMYTLGLNGDWRKQDIPIARYSAKKPSDISLYLSKVQEYELVQQSSDFSLEEKLWQKNVMHFIGGANESEQTFFLNDTRRGAEHIEKPFFGANIEEYLKDGNSAIDPAEFAILQEKIENGVSILQYYGHSNYSNGFDTNLDKPENWNNKGKYPIVVANGCNSGDLYRNTDVISNSEEYVVLADEGAIAYLSTTASGFAPPLSYITENLYEELSIKSYGETLGQSYANALSTTLTLYDNYTELWLGSFVPNTIHGDPMIRPNTYANPELIIPEDGISFSPVSPTLEDQTLTVNIDLYNVGRAISDSVKVELVRTFPNGQDSIYLRDVQPNTSHQVVSFKIPIDHSIAGGLNLFEVSVDIPSEVDEQYDETTNNISQNNLVIFSDGILPLLPFEFAITPEDNPDLIASTFNPDEEEAEYVFEIDTTDTFDSDWRYNQEQTSPGGSILLPNAEWTKTISGVTENLQLVDSTVYYWRAAKKEKLNWRESSFQYIKDRTGWEQAHFFQFKNDEYQSLLANRTTRKFEYDNSLAKVSVEMYANATGSEEIGGTRCYLFTNVIQAWSSNQGDPAIHVVVIDPNTLQVWGTPKIIDGVEVNPDHHFGQYNDFGTPGRKKPDYFFVYQQHDQTQLQNIQTLIDAVPNGYYIFFYSFKKADYANWDALHPGLYGELQALGADQIITGQADNMFSFLAKKGDPTATKQYYSAPIGTSHDLHYFEAEFTANSIGNLGAPLAGPTSRWNSIYWQQNPLETSSADSSRLYIYGNDGLGGETLLIDTLMSIKDSIKDLFTLIDADIYPYLRLRTSLWDNVTNTPAQLNRWQIMYDPVPEASVEPSLGLYYNVKNNTVQEGEDVEFAVAFKNISKIDMDSIMIKYWIEDQNHNEHILKYEKLDSLKVNQLMMDTVKFNSVGYGGDNTIWLEINPISASTGLPHQLEQYHFNNFYQKRLIVEVDKENPLVDVTFDGAHIFDGDIVSPSPKILIKFKDENPFLKMNEISDTSLFRVSMVNPDEIFDEQIYFQNGLGETVMQWYPASGDKNEFTIEYNPQNMEDGIYTLKVQGTDKSNNLSGDLSYDVQFEVINESSITHFYNYPNPFSTRTRFVFTLTGSQIPDDIYIQILTITGKVVKQITQDELGDIRIGKNVTEYYWDGTDDFGDVLANGVYLYRVVTKINGEQIKHRETSKDNLFKNNFGKLYIMR